MSLLKLTGKEFYWSILSGGKKIIEHQEEINKINVFPVPDGDTGSNLAATATSIIYHAKEGADLAQVASSIGEAALDGARGNSGVILAQFLYGIGEELQNSAELSMQKFASIVNKASEYVYKAIPHPQEGTIITVIREWAEYIQNEYQNSTDFIQLFEKAEKIAIEALNRTTEQLEVLNIAKVVDAGAKGFVLFIEGIKETLQKKAFSREDHDMEHLLINDTDSIMAEAETLTEESLHNRYCTETCLVGENICRDTVLEILEKDSDSIVAAGSDKKLRLHFHTNNPSDMFARLLKFGTFTFQKVEDMRHQYNVTHKRKNSIALVMDSGISLGDSYVTDEQITIVPLGVNVDGVQYQDGKTINLDIFKNYFYNPKSKTNTSQANPKTYADTFNYLSKYFDSIISVSMGKNMSSTINSAKQGRDLFLNKNPDYKIDIVDSSNLCAGGGSIITSIKEDINMGLKHEEVLEKAQNYIKNSRTFVNFSSIDHLLKSGRLGAFKGGIIKMLGLSPIIEVINGKVEITGKAFGFKKSTIKMLDNIEKFTKDKKIKEYIISHSDINPKYLEIAKSRLFEIFGKEAKDINIATPALATNVGMGAICIGITYQ